MENCVFLINYDDFIAIMMFSGVGCFITGYLIIGLIVKCRDDRIRNRDVLLAENII